MVKRAPGEGSIYRRSSDGKWVGVLSLGFNSAGKRRRKTFYGDTQRAVRVELEAAKAELEQGLSLSSKSPTVAMLLEDWLDHGRDSKGWEASTERRARIVVHQHLIPALGRHRVEKLTVRQVQKLLDVAPT